MIIFITYSMTHQNLGVIVLLHESKINIMVWVYIFFGWGDVEKTRNTLFYYCCSVLKISTSSIIFTSVRSMSIKGA